MSFDWFIAQVKNIVPPETKLSSLQDVKKFVDGFVTGQYKQLIYLACDILVIPDKARPAIIKRWQKDWIPFNKFAPYAAYILKIDLFFYVSMMLGLESKERPSHKIDLAYLYYLPFCNVFVSNDKLHSRIAPLFMEHGQVYVKGEEFKSGLKKVDEYFSQLPDDIKEQGVMKFATYPPRDVQTSIGDIWDKVFRKWRTHAEEYEKKRDLPPDKNLAEHLKNVDKESIPIRKQITSDQADHVQEKCIRISKQINFNQLRSSTEIKEHMSCKQKVKS